MRYKDLYVRNNSKEFWDTDESIDECNCGSFALDLTTWFTPYVYSDDLNLLEEKDAEQYESNERDALMAELLLSGCDREETMEIVLQKDWEFILKVCPWLRPIKKDEIVPSDRVIAYRLMLSDVDGEDFDSDLHTDFHFRVQIDGVWWEKNGAGPIHTCGTFADESPWHYSGLTYDSNIKYAKFKDK